VSNIVEFKKDEPADESPQLLVVHWQDIIATAGWEEGDEVSPPNLTTIGWLHSQTDEVLKIGNTLGEDGKPYGITAFPSGCITLVEAYSLSS